MKAILQTIRKIIAKDGITYKRTDDSWLTEWCAHNVLFGMHIARLRTASVDLNEDESKLKLLCYRVLAIFCK